MPIAEGQPATDEAEGSAIPRKHVDIPDRGGERGPVLLLCSNMCDSLVK
jgi:hypothetical protein